MPKQPKSRKDGNEIRLLGFLEKLRCQGKVHPVNGSWAVKELEILIALTFLKVLFVSNCKLI